MYKGEPASGAEFFEMLRADTEFCAELGRAMLAAGRLESELKLFLSSNGVLDTGKATLSQLTKLLERHGLLVKMQPHLDHLSRQRNYLAHSIHALFAELIEKAILPRSDLLDSDVHTFTERAWQLAENLNALISLPRSAPKMQRNEMSALEALIAKPIDELANDEALELIGQLVDSAADHGSSAGTTRAFELLTQFCTGTLSATQAATAHYFSANASHNKRLQRENTNEWAWEQPEVQSQILELRKAVQHKGFKELPTALRCKTHKSRQPVQFHRSMHRSRGNLRSRLVGG